MREETDLWVKPPISPDGEPIWVDVRFNLLSLSEIDTVAATASVGIAAIYYWTDSRLEGWPEDEELPPSLWGPCFYVSNAKQRNSDKPYQEMFALVNADSGRLKRTLTYSTTVDNPMQLQDFPFDLDWIDVNFKTYSNFMTYDRERHGQVPKGKTYRVRQIQEEGEGKWLAVNMGDITEWQLHGISTNIEEAPRKLQGSEPTLVPITFHLTRKSIYYFWKVRDQ